MKAVLGVMVVSVVMFVLLVAPAPTASAAPLPETLELSASVRVVAMYPLHGEHEDDYYVAAVFENGTDKTVQHYVLDKVCWLEFVVGLDAYNTFQQYALGVEGAEGYPEGFKRIILR